ncbi:MAG: ACP S-malonyltransferase [Deltaproteobacteria bacterium]|nr:ACP S-malonyltransferase [Deltaproteobacteria bacterium]
MSPPTPVAVVFPGQGSQKPGMARDFHDEFAVSRAVFEEASDALGWDVRAVCFEDDPRLDQTEITQPALLTAEIAMLRALSAEHGLRPTWFGGHSLGEYTALCAAGALPLATAVRIVHRRGALMQRAVPLGAGAMVAVVADGIAERDLVRELVDLEVDVANLNAPAQVVLSGMAPAVERATAWLSEQLLGTPHDFVLLNVSAPFHSRWMRGIEDELRAVLEDARGEFAADLAATVTSNLTGRFHRPDPSEVIDALTRQIGATVDWIGDMRALAEAAATIVEVGPSRPLRGFFRALGREVVSVVSVRTAQKGLGA